MRGAQKAKRLECERTLVLVPRGPRYDQALKDQVLVAYQKRMSLRGIRRTFGVCCQTVMAWLGKKRLVCRPSWTRYRPSHNGDVLELDEL